MSARINTGFSQFFSLLVMYVLTDPGEKLLEVTMENTHMFNNGGCLERKFVSLIVGVKKMSECTVFSFHYGGNFGCCWKFCSY